MPGDVRPLAPPSWSGPIQLYSGSPASAPATCPSAAPDKAFAANANVNQVQAECNAPPNPACSCSGETGLYCEVDILGVQACVQTSGCSTSGPAQSNACNATSCSPALMGFEEDYPGDQVPSPIAQWTATPSSVITEIPTITWATEAVGCGFSSLNNPGCVVNETCLPKPAAPFAAKYCIWQVGLVPSCPSTFPNETVYYQSALDSRGCSPCGCETNNSATCSGTVYLYSDPNCGTSVFQTSSFTTSGCLDLSLFASGGFQSWNMVGATFAGTPISTPVGAIPIGTLTPADPVSVCCTN